MSSSITNKNIIDKERVEGLLACCNYVKELSSESLKDNTIRSSILNVVHKFRKLNKSKSRPGYSDLIKEFENETYTFPTLLGVPRTKKSESFELIRDLNANTLKTVTVELAADLNESFQEEKRLESQNNELRLALSKKCSLKSKLKASRAKVCEQNRMIIVLKARIDSRNKEMKRLRSKHSYMSLKDTNFEHTVTKLKQNIENLKKQVTAVEIENKKISENLKDVTVENDYLRLLINDNIQRELQLFDTDKRMYTEQTQECVFELLNNNVTTSRVGPVIETVLKLAGTKPNKVPSTSTVNNINVQRLILAQAQIAEKLTQQDDSFCLLSDETSKFGKKYEGFHVSDTNWQLWVLDLRNMVTKSGKDTLKTLQDILGDIDEVSEMEDNLTRKQILLNITSTMSDRASTQLKFNELLEEYRTHILKEEFEEQWDEMSDAEKSSICTLNNFFCGLHVLVHVAEAASSCLLQAEKGLFESNSPIYDASFRKSNESGCLRLIRTASKAFSCGGDEKNGAYYSFSTYVKPLLTENHLHSVPVERFRGNIFNILFSNAAAVYFLIPDMKKFVEFNDSNRLLKSVKYDLDQPEYVAGCKALGLIAHLITIPLWCTIEDKMLHVLDSCSYYEELIEYLQECCENTQEFLSGNKMLSYCDEQSLQTNCIYQTLIKPSEYDNLVSTILKILLPGICKVCKELFKDSIDNGHWKNKRTDEKLRQVTAAVPKHNKFSETIFGHLDRIVREKPNVSMIANEAYIMFIHNRTLDWLQGKSEKERSSLLIKAIQNVKKSRKQFKERALEIEKQRQLILEEKNPKTRGCRKEES